MDTWKKLQPSLMSSRFKTIENCASFTSSNVRLIVFNNQSKMGRSCIYDSMPKTAKINKEKIDEIIFGSLVMKHRTNILKLHVFKNPNVIIISKIFISTSFHNIYNSHDTFLDLYVFDDLPQVDRRKDFSSLPITDIFCNSLDNYSTSKSTSKCDENILSSSAGSIYETSNITKPPRKLFMPKLIPPNLNLSNSKGEKQIAFAILFQIPPNDSRLFKDFIITHSILIEKEFDFLNHCFAKENYAECQNNINMSKINDIFLELLNRLNMLTKSTFISSWQYFLDSSSTRKKIINILYQDFSKYLQCLCGRSSKFFLASFLTAVLTHHLTWTSTLTKFKSSKSKCHNYEKAIFNQIREVYGAIGQPITACHVIISCNSRRRRHLIDLLLRFISLFIRFSVLSHKNSEASKEEKLCQGRGNKVSHSKCCDTKVSLSRANDTKKTHNRYNGIEISLCRCCSTKKSNRSFGNIELPFFKCVGTEEYLCRNSEIEMSCSKESTTLQKRKKYRLRLCVDTMLCVHG